MNTRQARLLEAIIDQFISTALPVGSKRLLESTAFHLSSATVRSEMSFLEGQGFLEQPHTSAGRIPTVRGYRVYVQQMMKPTLATKRVRAKFDELREQYLQHKDRERAYEAVALLASMIGNVSFATVPHRERVYYLGLSNVVKQPEFQQNAGLLGSVVEVLEKRLTALLECIDTDDTIRYFIGEKNLCTEFESCAMMVTRYRVRDQSGVIGILGPVRMDYTYDTVALEMVADLLRRE